MIEWKRASDGVYVARETRDAHLPIDRIVMAMYIGSRSPLDIFLASENSFGELTALCKASKTQSKC